MNPETKTGAGRIVLGSLLAIVLALFAPIIILTELMSLQMVVLVPAIGMMLLYRWAGKVPAVLSAMLQMVFTVQLLGNTFMWMAFLSMILPVLVLIRFDKTSFFTRMKASVAAFCFGTVAAVVALYTVYGGNTIERVLLLLPEALKTIPAEALQIPMNTLAVALGREVTVESFYILFDDMIRNLIPYYQMNLPGLLFSGSIVSAVLSAALGSYISVRRGNAPQGSHVPLRDWYLPASTTGGVLTMAIASYALYLLGLQQGQTLYVTVYSIAITVFAIQAMASFARRLHETRIKPGVQAAILIFIAVVCLMGGSLYAALYGLASAILGRKGSLRQKMEERQNHNKNNNSH